MEASFGVDSKRRWAHFGIAKAFLFYDITPGISYVGKAHLAALSSILSLRVARFLVSDVL